MNRGEIATWAVLPSAQADLSWLSVKGNKLTRRALRLGSAQLGALLISEVVDTKSSRFIDWLALPEAELRRSLGFASLLLFKQSLGPFLVSGVQRQGWEALLGAQALIKLLRMESDDKQSVDSELVPDWNSASALFHPGLALMYALLSKHCPCLASRLLHRFEKQDVQGFYPYLSAINVDDFTNKELLLFESGGHRHGYGYKT